MSSKLKGLLILLIIGASLIPVYLFTKYLQIQIRPRESLGRLLLYICLIFAAVAVASFVLVFGIRKIFPGA